MHKVEKDYRADIDGLRALAVVPVVLFHANMAGFSGGFVGVDIFFVISGYLISLILLRALDHDRFSLADFYERRIRRIVPALVAMSAITALAAICLLPPRELQSFGKSLIATALFYSNFFFSKSVGYFDPPASSQPMLHTWSLGVEEQFYIVWPLLLYGAYRLKLTRRALIILVASLLVASLIFAEIKSAGAGADRYFYRPQSRVWELMIGALLALGLVPQLRIKWQRDLAGVAGLIFIVVAIMMFDAGTPFPSLWTLVPCLGAALVIWAGGSGANVASSLLSLRPLVFVGLISYSLYLWHWPIFVFANVLTEHALTKWHSVLLVALSFVVAIASWRIVEQPYRKGGNEIRLSPNVYLAGGGGAIAAMVAVGMVLRVTEGLPGRLDAEALQFYRASGAVNPLRAHCNIYNATPGSAELCTVPRADRPLDVLVWGDSHASALFPALRLLAEQNGGTVRQMTKASCPPILGAERHYTIGPTRLSDCSKHNLIVLETIKASRPKLIVLAARWSRDTTGNPQDPNFLIDLEDQEISKAASERVLQRAIDRTVRTIRELGISVLLIGQAPEFEENPNACFVRKRMIGADAQQCLRQDRNRLLARLKVSNEILSNIAASQSGVGILYLHSFFCEEKHCHAARNSEPFYTDANHISLFAARQIGSMLISKWGQSLLAGNVQRRE